MGQYDKDLFKLLTPEPAKTKHLDLVTTGESIMRNRNNYTRPIEEDPYEYDNPLHNTIVIL